MNAYKLSAVLVLSVLAVAYFAAREYYQRPLERRCYEFAVSFEAEGKDYVLRTPITVQVFHGPPIAYGGVTIVTRPKVAAQRLPSGAGIFFNVPYHASRLAEDLTEVAGGPDQLPYAFWLDDVREPSKMEAYFSEQYYQQPSPRLRIKALSYGHAPECSPVDPGHEIPWLSLPREERFLRGHYAHVVPEQEWSKIPALARTLEQVSAFQRLPDEVAADFRVLTAWPPRYGGYQKTIRVAGRTPLPVTDYDGVMQGFLRPIVREGDHLRLLEDEPGLAIYYPEQLKGSYKLRIGDREVEVDQFNRWYFDPVGRHLMKLAKVTF